jgi:peptide/nickel transport system permease protein
VGTLLGVLSPRRPNGLLSQCITCPGLCGARVLDRHAAGAGVCLLVARAAGVGHARPMPQAARALPTCWTWSAPGAAALTLALVYLAQYSRLSRSSMLDVLGADYIRTARAKGLAEHVVLYRQRATRCCPW